MEKNPQTKRQMLALLEEERARWEALLARLSAERMANGRLPNGWTVTDLFAHLLAWDQLVLARLEAAQLDRDPDLPEWVHDLPPELDETAILKLVNDRIYTRFHKEPWEKVLQSWKATFQKIQTLAEDTSEADLLATGRHAWLKGRSLMDNLRGTYEHHHDEHYETFRASVGREIP